MIIHIIIYFCCVIWIAEGQDDVSGECEASSVICLLVLTWHVSLALHSLERPKEGYLCL